MRTAKITFQSTNYGVTRGGVGATAPGDTIEGMIKVKKIAAEILQRVLEKRSEGGSGNNG